MRIIARIKSGLTGKGVHSTNAHYMAIANVINAYKANGLEGRMMTTIGAGKDTVKMLVWHEVNPSNFSFVQLSPVICSTLAIWPCDAHHCCSYHLRASLHFQGVLSLEASLVEGLRSREGTVLEFKFETAHFDLNFKRLT